STPFTVAGVIAHSFPTADGREAVVMDTALAHEYFGSYADGFDMLQFVGPVDPVMAENAASRFGLTAVSVATIEQSARTAVDRTLGILLGVSVTATIIGLLAVL